MRSAITATILLVLALPACGQAQTHTQLVGPEGLRRAVTAGTQICLRHVIDGASERTLTQAPGISEVRYDIHGANVTRYQLDAPGAPEVTFFSDGGCRVQIDDQPYNDLLAVVDELSRDWIFIARPTAEYHQSRGPDVMVVDARDQFGDDGMRGRTICVRGERAASVQVVATSGVVRWGPGDETRDPPNLEIDVTSDLRPENCPFG